MSILFEAFSGIKSLDAFIIEASLYRSVISWMCLTFMALLFYCFVICLVYSERCQ